MLVLAIWLFCPFIGAAMLGRYDRAGTGFLLGLIPGPVGLLVALGVRQEPDTAPKDHVRCPHCAEFIRSQANVCRYCGRDVGALSAQHTHAVPPRP